MSFNANTGVTTRRIPLERFELTPAHITLIYLAFGFLALYGSDVLLVNYFDDPVLSELQAVKGVVEVAVTGILIYGLTRGSRAPLEARNERLARQRGELEVLHRVLRHNLRNDINIIHGYTRLIHTHAHEESEHKEWCMRVLDNVEGLLEYTERAEEIHRITEHDTAGPRSISSTRFTRSSRTPRFLVMQWFRLSCPSLRSYRRIR